MEDRLSLKAEPGATDENIPSGGGTPISEGELQILHVGDSICGDEKRASISTHIKRPFPELKSLSDDTHGASNIPHSIQGDYPLHNKHTRGSRGRTEDRSNFKKIKS